MPSEREEQGRTISRPASIETASTLLFVPIDKARSCEKAVASGADAVIFDLEDAVAPDAKATARARLAALPAPQDVAPLLAVRINAPETAAGALDLEALAELGCPVDAVVVPKASPESVAAVAVAVPSALVALVETAEGILHAEQVARGPAVVRLMFGAYDLAAELGCEPADTGSELLLARSQLVLASAAAGIAGPIDGPFASIEDAEALRAETERARRLGYGAKACIHPVQLDVVRSALAPRSDQVEWARRVIRTYSQAAERGAGVISLDGQMVDEPVARRARAILDRSGGDP